MIPAASYGISAAARAVEPTLRPGDRIVVLDEEFPSNVLPWRRVSRETGAHLVTVPRPRDHDWTSALLAESLGAAPLDLGGVRPDFLVAAGYKWLLAPYGVGVMYVAPATSAAVVHSRPFDSAMSQHRLTSDDPTPDRAATDTAPSTRRAITSPALAAPVGPFSHAVRAGPERDLVYVSGQVGQDPDAGTLVPGGTAAEAERALRNVAAVLAAAGLGLDDVVKANVYLADMHDFAALNAVYARHFRAPYPARTTVAVAALPLGARVEVEVVARGRADGPDGPGAAS